jgi:hypothetical protein
MAAGMMVAGADRQKVRSGFSGGAANAPHQPRPKADGRFGTLAGVTILDAAAMARFRGVAVRFVDGAEGDAPGDCEFELVLAHDIADRSVVIGRFGEEDIVAVWRSFAEKSGLPLMLERGDGSLGEPYRQIGRLRLGPVRQRRRHGLLAGRRPRFLVRRKTTRLPDRPIVHRGREIVGRD